MVKNVFSNGIAKSLSVIIALIMIVSLFNSTQVFAAETESQPASVSSSNVLIQPIEETQFTKDDAINTLGLTSEEAANSNFYVVTLQPQASTLAATHYYIPANVTWNWTPFIFTGYNGGSYWTVNANKIRWGVASYNGTYDSNYELRLGVYLWSYGQSNCVDSAWMYNGCTHFSDWIPVTWGHDYRFTYYCQYLSSGVNGIGTVQMYVVTSS